MVSDENMLQYKENSVQNEDVNSIIQVEENNTNQDEDVVVEYGQYEVSEKIMLQYEQNLEENEATV